MPSSWQDCTNARVIGCGSGMSDTPSGPSVPCQSPDSIVLPSERMKYSRTSAKDQPSQPSSVAQRS